MLERARREAILTWREGTIVARRNTMFVDWIVELWTKLGISWQHLFMVLGWILSLFVTFVILPYLKRLIRIQREQAQMIKRKIFENTGVVIFGVFDRKLQSDYLGGFLTTVFGEVLFDLIVGWNDKPSPNLIVPDTDCHAEHMKEILAAYASPYILQSNNLECYFRDAKRYGTPHYQYAKLIVALARPDAEKLNSHDYPRVIVMEEGMLRRLAEDGNIDPQWKTKEGFTWLETVRELAQRYAAGDFRGMTVLELPLCQ
jgi:hypothetical protein